MFPLDFYSYLENNTLVEIKGGSTRSTFLKIWMVDVEKRIFARSWNRSAKSWFTEFQQTGIGEIKYGDKVLEVKGIKISAEDPINPQISQAYIKKYDQPENLKYSEAIAQPGYFAHTMEFFSLASSK